MKKLRSGVFAILCLSAIRLDAGTAGASAPAGLLSFERGPTELVFSVISTGCTRQSDFRLQLDSESQAQASSTLHISLKRLRKDLCRMRPHVKPVVIALAEHDLPEGNSDVVDVDISLHKKLLKSPLVISNPFVVLHSIRRQ